MNGWLLSAGVAAAAVAGVHVVAGHIDPVRPLLDSALPDVPKRTLHVVWHWVSVDLVLSALTLVALAVAEPTGTELVALLTALHFAAYTVVFVVVATALPGPRRLLRLPQWMLLAPIAVLALAGAV
ncbi:hypothetical protein APR12_003406 [Nocardia amikacinitolerans]|uniref:hypothetical protein n=1 Tax=Nocardia amikacinitolerans TaxID=756689 RepID=UPI00082C0C7F|nr:hypothetical protein [Nocardia amikacinitolerans]MCP2318053.1 hypothetical protein [Nocardia amikacinitolerans]